MPSRATAIPATATLMVAATCAFVAGASDDAEEVLRSKGLYLRGGMAVLSTERELSKGLSKRRPQGQMHTALDRIEEIRQTERGAEAALDRAKGAIEQAITNRRGLKSQLQGADRAGATVEERNRVVAAYNDAGDRIAQAHLDAQRIYADLEKIRTDLAQAKADYVQAIHALRSIADETIRRYEDLAADNDVKQALASLNADQSGRRPYRLGPSSTFKRNVKRLEKLEKTVLSETIELERRGGVCWVEVICNGKQPLRCVLDTGAAFVTITPEMAAKIGLTPTADDRTIELKVADGRTVQGRLTRLESVRVGAFTEQDVACVVLPGSLKGAAPLLGQSFLKRFAFEFDPSAGKLSLTKVDLPEADRPKPSPRGARGRRRR